MIGLWASNPSVGDIVGQQLYLLYTRNNSDHWGYTFMTLGGIVQFMAFVNLFCLIEWPRSKGISIKEEGSMLNPNRISVKKLAKCQEDNDDIPEINFRAAFSIFGLLQFAFSFFFIKFAFYGVYYWIPEYLQITLKYTKVQAGDIMSLGSVGGILGSIIMGLCSDLLMVKSPVHLLGCIFGAASLLVITSVKTNSHTTLLTSMMASFNFFEGGATIIIAVILCDIGKDELLKRKRRAVATISGINDGIAGFGSILG